jgi:hypothetical protein
MDVYRLNVGYLEYTGQRPLIVTMGVPGVPGSNVSLQHTSTLVARLLVALGVEHV